VSQVQPVTGVQSQALGMVLQVQSVAAVQSQADGVVAQLQSPLPPQATKVNMDKPKVNDIIILIKIFFIVIKTPFI